MQRNELPVEAVICGMVHELLTLVTAACGLSRSVETV